MTIADINLKTRENVYLQPFEVEMLTQYIYMYLMNLIMFYV